MKLIGWKVWYSDGMTITSKTNKWIHIPMKEFQILKKFYDDKTSEVLAGAELYTISSNPDEMEKLIKEDFRNVKIGQQIDNALFNALYDLSKLDPEIVEEMV